MPYLVNPRLATPREIPAYQGAQTDTVIQLASPNGQPAAGIFGSSTTLGSAVWQGQNQQQLAYPAVSWFTGPPTQTGYDQGQVLISPNFGDVALLDPGGEYLLQVYATTGSDRTVAAECRFKVLASPGFTSPSPPDLITYDYCLGQLTGVDLSDAQIDLIPGLVTAASDAWRLECNRYFDLRTLTESHEVPLTGVVRLWQEPVQIITRVQGQPNLAITVYNNSSSVQVAQAYFSFTGSSGGYTANAKTATGITLNWVSGGTFFTQTLLFSTYPTLALLGAAISVIGSGWTALVTDAFSSWLCTELVGGFIAQGCTQFSSPNSGAEFNVLTDLDNCRLFPDTPMLWVGTQRGGNVTAAQWGPGGEELWGDDGDYQMGQVKVTYQAGYATIPQEVQYQVAQIVKWKLELAVQELLLKSETAAEYKYELAADMVHHLPNTVREAAGRWKSHYA